MPSSRREFLALLASAGLCSCKTMRRAGEMLHIPGLGDDKSDKAEKEPKPETPQEPKNLKVSGKRFTFATIGDLHVLDARSTAIVSRAVRAINEDERIRFTAVLGDIATDAKFGELHMAKMTLDKLEKGYYAVPGNHDVDTKSLEPFASYERLFGEPHWVFEDFGWVFMGINSCEGAKSDVVIQPDEIEWLQKKLKRVSRRKPIALFAHHPFNPNTKAYRVGNADEVIGLFGAHHLKLIAAGHFHGNQVEEQNGILFTTTACCSDTRGNHDGTEAKGYRLFHIEKDRIETEFVAV